MRWLQKYGNWLLIIIGIILFSVGISLSSKATVVIEWSTSSELNTVGFYIYRREKGNDAFAQVNSTMIPSSSDPMIGGDYSFLDYTTSPGRIYIYALEEITLDGSRTRIGETEIQSQSGGMVELIAALIFILLGFTGLVLTQKRKRLCCE